MRRAEARRAATIIACLTISTLLLAQPSAKQAAAERANVRRIAARIHTHAKDARRAYHVTIPNTTVAYDMVPIPAGEFVMGSDRQERRAAAAQSPPRRLLDAGA